MSAHVTFFEFAMTYHYPVQDKYYYAVPKLKPQLLKCNKHYSTSMENKRPDYRSKTCNDLKGFFTLKDTNVHCKILYSVYKYKHCENRDLSRGFTVFDNQSRI